MAVSSARDDGKHLILLGTHDVYIHSVLFDPVARTLEQVGKKEISQDPSWLTKHPRLDDIVYSNGHVKGKVYCLRVSPRGDIEVLDEATSGGRGPTHLAVNQDHSALLIAHYGQNSSGLLSTVPLDPETGRFLLDHAPPSQFFQPAYTRSDHPRLDAPHVHHVMTHGNEVITCDLGCNKLWRLRQGGDEDSSRWVVSDAVEGFEDGDGPRHAVIHPNGKFIYVLNEVSSTLSVHTLPSSPGVPSKRLYRHIMLPGEDQGNTEMTGAEIILLPSLSPSGPQLLILTNRYSTSSRGDALALFEVSNDGETVRPARSPHYWGVGKHIRALEADPRGKYICTAGRDAGGVVILERVGDGTELKEVCRLEVPNVVVPIWVS